MPEKRANTVVFKNKNILLSHKKILILLIIILITLPVTVFLALNRQNFLNHADAGSVIETIEVSPGEVKVDLNSTEPVNLSALAYDSFGDPVYYLDVNYEWSMSSTNSVGTLSGTNSEITQFQPLNYGCGQITVIASWTQEVVTKTISVAVSDGDKVPNCLDEPTTTVLRNPASLKFSNIKLHGIGIGGDNLNASITGNLNPLRNTREISIYLEDSSGNSFPAGIGEVNYSSVSGVFSGTILLDESIANGDYLVKIKSPQYLRRQVDGILKIIEGEVSEISEVSLVTGDINDNNSVDISDYNFLIDCYSDLLPARNCNDEEKKTASDLSDDGLVNADDYNLFIRELSALSGD